jgi:protein-disulfide isomerase
MSSTTPRPGAKPTKAERRDEAREQARVLREQQAKRDRRNKIGAIAGLSLAVVLLLGVVGYIIVQQVQPGAAYTADDRDELTLSDVTAPAAAGENGGIPVSAAGVGETGEDDVVVSVYFDYMCPYCGQFEAANQAELESLVADGGVTVDYHVISFLDRASAGAEFSTRAGNAAAVVADQAPEQFPAFHGALFENQPDEGTKGLSDARIADIAREAGVPQDVVDQFTATAPDGDWRTFAPWVVAATNQAARDLPGGISTPTVLIDGKQFTGDLYTPGPLTAAVEAARG